MDGAKDGFQVQWYPGHMTKTRRQMESDLKQVDLVAEVIDARIPRSSRNPDIDALCGQKPRLVVLNRADQADPAGNQAWRATFRADGCSVIETDAKSGAGVARFAAAARETLAEQIARWQARGLVGRPVRVMVVGVPNVGKSTFINKIAHRRSAKTADRPGVTRGKQWITAGPGLDLLDTPGILWPKFDDAETGLHLAFTGAVRDRVMDVEDLACRLMTLLAARYPDALAARYQIAVEPGAAGWELLEAAARRRGFLMRGGEVDTGRMADILLDEYRAGKLGRFTLEWPEAVDAP